MTNIIKSLIEEDRSRNITRQIAVEQKIDNIAQKQDEMQDSLDRMETMLLSHIEREKGLFQELTSSISELSNALSGKKDDGEK